MKLKLLKEGQYNIMIYNVYRLIEKIDEISQQDKLIFVPINNMMKMNGNMDIFLLSKIISLVEINYWPKFHYYWRWMLRKMLLFQPQIFHWNLSDLNPEFCLLLMTIRCC